MPSIIDTAKGPIEVRVEGKGCPILFVHDGHVDCRETIFQKGLDADKFLFIAVSRPGYGKTLLTESNKSPRGTADLIIALLDELKISRATIIGISAGGLTALEIAANYRNRVKNLVLISALTKKWFIDTDSTYRGGKMIFAPRIQKLTWSLYRFSFNIIPNAVGRLMFRELSNYRPIEFDREELKELKGMTVNMNSGHGFSNDLDQTIDQGTLSRIHCPTLILHSEYDNAVDLSHATNAKLLIKHARLVEFKNRWGHLLWIGKEYSAVVRELEDFIREQ
jgi:pimeloyl-ACP methyl ester carboxylesterase